MHEMVGQFKQKRVLRNRRDAKTRLNADPPSLRFHLRRCGYGATSRRDKSAVAAL
jgi:hypothetical protein